VVTVRLTVPAAWGLVTTRMEVGLKTVLLLAVVAANFTAVAPSKPVPVIVTVDVPDVVPVGGVNEVTVGTGATYLNLVEEVPVPAAVTTLSTTVPGACGGETAVTLVGLVTVKLAAGVVLNWTFVAP
jgi:hypothetical protein